MHIVPTVMEALTTSSGSSSTAAMTSFNEENVSVLGFRETDNQNGTFGMINYHDVETYHKSKSLKNQPDTALLSAILLLTTFLIAFKLRKMRNSFFFGRTVNIF